MKTAATVLTLLALLVLFPSGVMAETELRVDSKDLQEDYERVWSAAIDTLYETDLPIGFMSRADGYIVTGRLETKMDVSSFSVEGRRVMVTLRFVKDGSSIVVKIRSAAEEVWWHTPFTSKEEHTPFYKWEPVGTDAAVEAVLKRKLIAKVGSGQ